MAPYTNIALLEGLELVVGAEKILVKNYMVIERFQVINLSVSAYKCVLIATPANQCLLYTCHFEPQRKITCYMLSITESIKNKIKTF